MFKPITALVPGVAMKKTLVRWGAVLGLVGGAMLVPLVTGVRVLALPDDQIVQKLRPIPVFAIADAQGAPLVASGG